MLNPGNISICLGVGGAGGITMTGSCGGAFGGFGMS
jgi:hypothetical protein